MREDRKLPENRTNKESEYKTIRIFISSTFRDMQAERDHLVRFVFPRLREELLARRIRLVDVDLRWGVTGDQDALEVCRETIEECQPYFVCMLGGRYGWIPSGKMRSITAEEVHYGVLDREIIHKDTAFFYFRDPQATAAMIESKPGEFREPENSPGQMLLQDLKNTILKSNLKTFTYSAKWDNRSQRLIDLKEFGERVYTDIITSINAKFEELPVALNEFEKDAAEHKAFIAKHTERFILGDRRSIFEKMLLHTQNNGGNGYLCVSGISGSGKSALLAYLSQHLERVSEPKTLVISHFVGASSGSTRAEGTLRRLYYELMSGAGMKGDIPKDYNELRMRFSSILKQACEQKQVVILLDAVNELDDFSWLPSQFPDNARIIITTIPGPALDRLRQWQQPPLELELPALTQGDSETIIEQFLHTYRKNVTDEQRTALLAKEDSKTPLYLLTALEELRTLGTYEEISDHISHFPPRTQDLFAWILKRLEQDDGFRDAQGKMIGHALIPQFAKLLVVSRHGLSERELVRLLDPENGNTGSAEAIQGNLAALVRLLRPYLMYRGELLDFYHNQFRESSRAVYLSEESEQQAAHRKLADYFYSQACSFRDGGMKEPEPRAFSELLFHLQKAGMWDTIITCLNDPVIFKNIPPMEYNVNYDSGVYICPAKDAMVPDSLCAISSAEERSEIASGIASAFAERARERIRQAERYDKPWSETAQYLREHDNNGFFVYRDIFYSFIRLAGKAAEYAAFAVKCATNRNATKEEFLEKNRDVSSFLYNINNNGYEITGLSHAIEDDCFPSYKAWNELRYL